MRVHDSALADSNLDTLDRFGLISKHERFEINELARAGGPFVNGLALAETMQLHIKVDDTDILPERAFLAVGAKLDHSTEGLVKYLFPARINIIFSHIKVSQDELVETESNRRPRPFLDHMGIDLRDEAPQVRATFEELATLAEELQW
jgi:hypothetical protein